MDKHKSQVSSERLAQPRILGLDPGVTTGVALLKYLGDAQFECIDTIEIRNVTQGNLNRCLNDFIARADEIVIEAFVGSGMRDRNITQTLETVGWLKALAYHDGKPPIMHVPAARRPYIEVARDIVGRRPLQKHATDAAAHAVAHALKPRSGLYKG